jgi:hypothetical protein
LADPEGAFWLRWGPGTATQRDWWKPENPRFNELGEQQRQTLDQQFRARAFQDALDIWEEEAPGTVLWIPIEHYAMRDFVKWTPYSFYYMDLRPDNLSLARLRERTTAVATSPCPDRGTRRAPALTWIPRKRMPFVHSLAAEGTRLTRYAAAYPPHTRVQVATMCTGTYPGQHGIVSNVMVLEEAGEDGILDTSDFRQIAELDRRTQGRAILRPPLADLLAARGQRLAVAASGSTGSSWLWARTQPFRLVNPRTVFGLPDLAALREKLGPPPDPTGLVPRARPLRHPRSPRSLPARSRRRGDRASGSTSRTRPFTSLGSAAQKASRSSANWTSCSLASSITWLPADCWTICSSSSFPIMASRPHSITAR